MDIDKILDEFPKKMKEKREAEKGERKRWEAKVEAERDEIDRCFRDIIRPALAEVERKVKKKEKDYYCEIEGVPPTSTPIGDKRYSESALLFYSKEKARQDYKGIAYRLIFKAEGDYIVGTMLSYIENKLGEKKFSIKAIYKAEVESFVGEFIIKALEDYKKGSP